MSVSESLTYVSASKLRLANVGEAFQDSHVQK